MRILLIVFISIATLLANQLNASGFIENKGQWDGPFLFKKEVKLGAIFLEKQAITFNLKDATAFAHGVIHDQDHESASLDSVRHHAFKLIFENSNPDVMLETDILSNNYYNFFLGKDQNKWHSNIHAAAKVIYRNLYNGIDLHVYDQGEGMKYEFHVQPFADPSQISIKTIGLDGIEIDRDGQLILKNTISDIIELKPVLYQEIRGKKRTFAADFKVSDNLITYDFDGYDSTKTLVIDPDLVFSTYSGSGADNWGYTATPDRQGFLVSGGIVVGTGYPLTTGAYNQSYSGGPFDIGITKYDTSGTTLIFSTYLGGDEMEAPHSLICDNNNDVFILGATSSDDFPTTSNAFDQTFNGGTSTQLDGIREYDNGSDIYIAKLSDDGTQLLASTYIGGSGNDGLNLSGDLVYNYSDQSRGEINLDESGNVYVSSSTTSNNFPVSANALRTLNAGGQDAVVFKMNNTLSTLIFSTYLGGSADDAGYAIDIASDNTVYVAGGTASSNFHFNVNGFDSSYGGLVDGYILRLNDDASTLLNSTFIGTNRYDQVYLLQLDEDDNPHYFGQSESTNASLILNANYSVVGGGQIVGRLTPDLSAATWLTRFGTGGGATNLSPTAMLVDICNNVYLAGWGGALNNRGPLNGLTTTVDAFKSNGDGNGDFYFLLLPNDASQILFASYFGGNTSGEHVDGGTSRFDPSGKIYQSVCAGCGGFDDFPSEPNPGAWSPNNGSNNCNNGVFKIDFELPLVIAEIDILPDYGCAPYTLAFENISDPYIQSSYAWDFGNGQTSTQTNPVVTYTKAGTYDIRLVITDPASCNLTDTVFTSIEIKVDTNYTIPGFEACAGVPVQIGPNPDSFNLGDREPFWVPSNLVSDPTILNPTVTINEDQTFRLILDYDGCFERVDQTITIEEYEIDAGSDTIICSDFTPFNITGTAYGDAISFEWSKEPTFDNIVDSDSILNVNNLDDALNYFYLRTLNDEGCYAYDTVLVTISDFDIQLTLDTAVCLNDSFSIFATSENPLNTFHYFWKTERFTGIPSAPFMTDTTNNFIRVSLDQDTSFYLYANSVKVPGCNITDSVFIEVSDLSQLDVLASSTADSFLISNLVELEGLPGEPYNYSWSGPYLTDNTAQNTTARPKDLISQYIYTVSDPSIPACTYSDSVTVYGYDINCGEPDIFIPDAFTPNGDGANDLFFVRGSVVDEVSIHIYDRWGKEVFTSEEKTIGWDGTFEGEKLAPAVFDYYLDATCINGRKFFKKGNISLLNP